MENEYLSRVVGAPLTQCLAELTGVKPRDPIEWIAHWLYRFMDNEIYFFEKSIYLKDLYRMQLEVEKQRALRQNRLNELNAEIRGIKQVGDEKMSISQMYLEKKVSFRKKSMLREMALDDDEDYDEEMFARMSKSQRLEYLRLHPSKLHKLQHKLTQTELDRMLAFSRTSSGRLIHGITPAGQPGLTAEWRLDHCLGLICDHPLLGSMRGRPPIIPPETPEWWQRQGYLKQTLYDHEVYSDVFEDPPSREDGVPFLTYRDMVHRGHWLQEGNLRGMQASLQECYRMEP